MNRGSQKSLIPLTAQRVPLLTHSAAQWTKSASWVHSNLKCHLFSESCQFFSLQPWLSLELHLCTHMVFQCFMAMPEIHPPNINRWVVSLKLKFSPLVPSCRREPRCTLPVYTWRPSCCFQSYFVWQHVLQFCLYKICSYKSEYQGAKAEACLLHGLNRYCHIIFWTLPKETHEHWISEHGQLWGT